MVEVEPTKELISGFYNFNKDEAVEYAKKYEALTSRKAMVVKNKDRSKFNPLSWYSTYDWLIKDKKSGKVVSTALFDGKPKIFTYIKGVPGFYKPSMIPFPVKSHPRVTKSGKITNVKGHMRRR